MLFVVCVVGTVLVIACLLALLACLLAGALHKHRAEQTKKCDKPDCTCENCTCGDDCNCGDKAAKSVRLA